MRLRPKYLLYMLISIGVIIVLTQPAILLAISNVTPKEFYAPPSLVITIPASANQDDLRYCYLGSNHISVSVVFYNTPSGNPTWMSQTISQLLNANITITVAGYHYKNESAQNYYDYEYESMLTTYRNNDNANLVVSFAQLAPQPHDSFGNLAGYSRVTHRLSIIFMPSLQQTAWAMYIAVHEISHNLGFFPEPNGHSSTPSSLMYPYFSGSNTKLLPADLNLLESLHK